MALLLTTIKSTMKSRYKDPDKFTLRKIISLDTGASLRKNTVQFIASVRSSKGKRIYDTRIQFQKTRVSSKQINKKDIKLKTPTGELYYKAPRVKSETVKMFCSCDSFQHEYSWQLADQESLIGQRIKYRRKTPPSQRPKKPSNPNLLGKDFVNPDNIIGYCVHLHSLIKDLKKKELIK